jgi:AAHS family 4-hydroxybenzoate transporter-like MFS transporter
LASYAAAIDVGEVLDAHRIGRFQIVTVALCALAMIIDGYGLYLLAYVLVPLARHFHVAPAALTPIVVSQFVGVAIGSYALSPLADRIGRKTVMMSCIILLALSTLLLPLMETMTRFGILRFISGVFIAGVVPNAIALASEIVPRRVRATTVGLLYMGFSAGPTLAAAAAAAFLPTHGWEALFVVGGVIPLLLVPLLGWMLPESLRFLVIRRPEDPRIIKILKQVAPDLPVSSETKFLIPGEERRGVQLAVLFRDGRAANTVLLWSVFFAVGLNLALLGAWLPTMMVAGGVAMQRALVLAAIYGGGAICGALLWSIMADYFRSPAGVLTVGLLCAAGALLGLPLSNLGSWPGAADVFFIGGCLVGAVTLLSGLAAISYPTSIRATGIGWGIGAGRVANVIGPAIGGMMLGAHWELASVTYVVTSVTLLGMLGAFTLWARQRAPALSVASPRPPG